MPSSKWGAPPDHTIQSERTKGIAAPKLATDDVPRGKRLAISARIFTAARLTGFHWAMRDLFDWWADDEGVV